MRRKNSFHLAALLLLCLAALGCSKKEAPPAAQSPQAPAPKSEAKPAAAVQKPMSSATQEKAVLDFKSKTDPFKPFTPVVAAPAKPNEVPAAPKRPAADLLPIQSYEVSKFKVSGIIAGLNENRALVIDPAGKGYVVSPGMEIGSNGGRISRITASTVEVVESYREDNKGRLKKRTIVLTLAKKR